jgi:hypothetical protein
MNDLLEVDFTVLVVMGNEAISDRFFIVPTRVVREALEAGRTAFYKIRRRDGGPRVETGQITLWLRPLRDGRDDGQHDFGRKWECYLARWDLLSGISN